MSVEKIENPFDFVAGEVLLVNKPKGWSSFDVVKKIRNLVKIKKVGHAGTLDPLASGLLILCTGKATKTIESIQGGTKEYEVTFRLGATTPSYDAEHPPENFIDASHITSEMVVEQMKTFVGDIIQVPPVFSAVKIDGKRAYKAARKGQEIALRKRMVTVEEFELETFESPECVTARITCGKGTYIRSLVHDLGQNLGVGGYILDLKRTRIGEHTLDDAWEIEAFRELILTLRKQNKPKQ